MPRQYKLFRGQNERILLGKCGTLLAELNNCNKELRINNYEEGLCQCRQSLFPSCRCSFLCLPNTIRTCFRGADEFDNSVFLQGRDISLCRLFRYVPTRSHISGLHLIVCAKPVQKPLLPLVYRDIYRDTYRDSWLVSSA